MKPDVVQDSVGEGSGFLNPFVYEIIIIVIIQVHQHKAAGVKLDKAKTVTTTGYHTVSNVARKATAFTLIIIIIIFWPSVDMFPREFKN